MGVRNLSGLCHLRRTFEHSLFVGWDASEIASFLKKEWSHNEFILWLRIYLFLLSEFVKNLENLVVFCPLRGSKTGNRMDEQLRQAPIVHCLNIILIMSSQTPIPMLTGAVQATDEQ